MAVDQLIPAEASKSKYPELWDGLVGAWLQDAAGLFRDGEPIERSRRGYGVQLRTNGEE